MPKKTRLLLAEDEESMAKALEIKLSLKGFDVEVAKDGEAAIAALVKGKFDLVLLDLIMPKKDGFGVLEDMKANGDKTPVIILSNLSQDEDIRRTKELGAVGFFIKSDTPIIKIVEEVEKALA